MRYRYIPSSAATIAIKKCSSKSRIGLDLSPGLKASDGRIPFLLSLLLIHYLSLLILTGPSSYFFFHNLILKATMPTKKYSSNNLINLDLNPRAKSIGRPLFFSLCFFLLSLSLYLIPGLFLLLFLTDLAG